MADQVKTTQVAAQVETELPAKFRVYQVAVQVEYEPGADVAPKIHEYRRRRTT
jgi:hypothetical protein